MSYDMVIINLPLPSKELSPNARGHWKSKLAIKNKAKCDAYYITKGEHSSFTQSDRLDCQLIVTKRTKALYDLDNIAATCKDYFDGVFMALGLDDSQIDRLTVIRGKIGENNPGVVLTITKI